MGEGHAVVYFDGELVYDPHPDDNGLTAWNPNTSLFLIFRNPEQHERCPILDIRDYARRAGYWKLLAVVRPRGRGARAVAARNILAQNWLRSLGTNKRGWPSTKFLRTRGPQCHRHCSARRVTLRADHRLRQRWLVARSNL